MGIQGLLIPRIDAIGGAVVLLGICVAAWFGPLKADSAAEALEGITNTQLEMQAEHSQLQKAIQINMDQWRALKERAQREGNLDDQLPVQDRLRTIREMATRHGWHDLQIMPVQWRSAVDVAEQTFSISGRAGYHELISFFKSFEQSKTWADISHLSVEPIRGASVGGEMECRVELTLNFYSSYVNEDDQSLVDD